ncbi:unnamed protein product [Spirodela intermedia]|uniref:DYW domain-containing protein n=1 Tax=Spirodela intermedia TaxID=51605 RepID=A0A7I8J4A4_SPIIN|nr:unnamed protein product [Spirodela intermedia]CAA6664901.1 unnamed protein product [Spirodela intermedia]
MEGRHLDALLRYRDALRSSASSCPVDPFFAFPAVLKSCAALSLPSAVAQLHARAVRSGCHSHPFVLTSLISTYAPSSSSSSTLTVCYNALISGFAVNGLHISALSLFRRMLRCGASFNSITMLGLLPCGPHLPLRPLSGCSALHACNVKAGTDVDPAVANCLITMYARCGAVDLARRVFDCANSAAAAAAAAAPPLPTGERDAHALVRWNSMVSAYAQNGLAAEALELYQEMVERAGVEPDAVTMVEQRISGDPSFSTNTFLLNALINMNARTVVSWTAIISGYGIHGEGRKAAELFDKMLAAGVRPDGVVMVSVLAACSHAGLTEEGLRHFRRMEGAHGLAPGTEHYACVVDLLGRAGRLQEAQRVISSMPVAPDGAVWGALLGACKIHRDVETAELAFRNVVALEPGNVGYYVLMANIYSDAGRLDGAARVREPGVSYVEHGGSVHTFFADDGSHPQAGEIHRLVGELEALVGGGGGAGRHSERLAVAFALMNSEPGEKLVVIKNLRVCEDCHMFLRRVSAVVGREITVRDATRFHHFAGGECSCNGYW